MSELVSFVPTLAIAVILLFLGNGRRRIRKFPPRQVRVDNVIPFKRRR